MKTAGVDLVASAQWQFDQDRMCSPSMLVIGGSTLTFLSVTTILSKLSKKRTKNTRFHII